MQPHALSGVAFFLSLAGCASDPPDPAPQLPCDVSAVLESSCQPCHSSPPQHGAPIPLVTYEDTQTSFTSPPTYDGTPVWRVIRDTIETQWMPQPWPGVSLTSDGRTTLLDWTAHAAPSAAPGVSCP